MRSYSELLYRQNAGAAVSVASYAPEGQVSSEAADERDFAFLEVELLRAAIAATLRPDVNSDKNNVKMTSKYVKNTGRLARNGV